MNDNRSNKITFRVSNEELDFIRKKMALTQCKKMSDFVRIMLLSGAVYNVDMTELTELRKLISSISNNINQIALRINTLGNVYKDDIDEVKEKVNEIWQQQVYILSQLHKLKP